QLGTLPTFTLINAGQHSTKITDCHDPLMITCSRFQLIEPVNRQVDFTFHQRQIQGRFTATQPDHEERQRKGVKGLSDVPLL
ncbi:MAG: hypothetical protein KZQ79_07515, partial [Candidatus Thiodiazotropha sp. (ex Lucinoma borealis)]|nr:hypothetical protein [Candidatus Thiodiazotropha sp. (ex Lucinoma borealis)]